MRNFCPQISYPACYKVSNHPSWIGVRPEGTILANDVRPELLGAYRLEIWIPLACHSEDNCRPSITQDAWEEKYKKTFLRNIRNRLKFLPRSDPTAPIRDLTRIRAFIPAPLLVSECPIPLFDRLPNLEILSWALGWQKSFLDSVIHHKVHQNLTHLQIHIQPSQVHALKSPVNFINLRFLSLHLRGDRQLAARQTFGHLDLCTWAKFPKLEGLCLGIRLEMEWYDEVISFLRGVGANLLSLVLGGETLRKFLCGTEQGSTGWFTTETWDLFPSLLHFGLYDDVVRRYPPPPPITRPPLNLIYRFIIGISPIYAPGNDCFSQHHESMEQVVQACAQWGTKQMTMFEAWHEAKSKVSGINILHPLTVG
ncbi:hypothetical protein M408DRAFT_24597 [Serendipita vermifera MAFF 305830]|uniref:Uncharacterized protein n=1 Tax=Serendipita vermifera MAFF 305830 TaxID=933852 RepID=A0A0C2WM54_SERVB|nr:hypothetical protein M408DRAFT_24597 [Serendipita vermifera MAFF 305830]